VRPHFFTRLAVLSLFIASLSCYTRFGRTEEPGESVIYPKGIDPSLITPGQPAWIFIASIPPVAEVYMDSTFVGKTNIQKIKVTSGRHSIKIVKGDKSFKVNMVFKEGDNASELFELR